MQSIEEVIETTALTKCFGDFIAVDAVTLRVRRGATFGLIGPNGAGKSTLMKMLTTLLPPTSGQASIAGWDLAREPQRVREHIGYVPQLLSADGALTGYENLLMSARLYLVPRRERQARIEAALKMMSLQDAAHRLVQGYSGGMIRRLEIAQAMIHRPAVLFMDEPTVGLDPIGRHAVWGHVRRLRDDFGTTIFVTTHLMDEADELCDEIGILHAGRLEEVGAPRELKDRIGPGATLDDVFAHVVGVEIDSGGSYRDVRENRRDAGVHS
jgi:ABC-2 type transport system ATP-binding protein